jgi:hypothetical protein
LEEGKRKGVKMRLKYVILIVLGFILGAAVRAQGQNPPFDGRMFHGANPVAAHNANSVGNDAVFRSGVSSSFFGRGGPSSIQSRQSVTPNGTRQGSQSFVNSPNNWQAGHRRDFDRDFDRDRHHRRDFIFFDFYPIYTDYAPYYYSEEGYSYSVLSVIDIANMAERGLSDDQIIYEIQNTGSLFRLTTSDIAYLRNHHVSNRVIDFILTRVY